MMYNVPRRANTVAGNSGIEGNNSGTYSSNNLEGMGSIRGCDDLFLRLKNVDQSIINFHFYARNRLKGISSIPIKADMFKQCRRKDVDSQPH